jgi:hypothetical protein
MKDTMSSRLRASPAGLRGCAALCLFALWSPACAPARRGPAAGAALAAPAERRAILVSFDALNERRALETLSSEATPNIRGLFGSAACAAYARPAFPSVTAPGHASLWTGAYGDVNGITANSQPRLPRSERSLLESVSGYSAEALRAEPVWITAAGSGRVVVGHHVTQAPAPPGYPAVDGEADGLLLAARQRAAGALARPSAHVLNGYNRLIAPDTVLSERAAPPRAAIGWRGLERLPRGVPPREIAWAAAGDSLFGLLYGRDRYTHLRVARTRDVGAGVSVAAAPTERESLGDRPLARLFSEPLEIPVEGGRVFLRVRLWELAPDGSRFLLFQPALQAVEANRPEVAAAYDAAVQGWIGNGATRLLDRGRFGPPFEQGGDGTAEARYLETAELVTRQFIRGSEWAWREVRPSLLVDYFPLGDEVDHAFYGWTARESPHWAPETAARAQAVREHAWALVDLRLGHLRGLVAADPAAALFVSGDHGMRATWRTFRPNVALAAAGLLATDAGGRIDLAWTRALSPNGYWVSVNRTAWRGGIVPPAEEAAAVAAAERALLAARDEAGRPVVTRIWRAAEHDSLGLGGPVGGDLYYETAEGFRWSGDPRGPVAGPSGADAGHGFPSVASDMWTVLCAEGAAFGPRRIGPGRTIDATPTVAEWLGIPAPADARGRSLLAALLGR